MVTPNITELHRASAHPRPAATPPLAPSTPAPDRRITPPAVAARARAGASA
ncbi:hypothetical protein NBH00_17950 [Paraconexibacter antarcticus]|uniref:Uncharacterized protein n=1 Tax=Paraconexibacter antarcticus TaxID=2949664 RepID=A0ABY5DP61_9ACTN|nr:hypothetical protein [Paraconexibacter antarcticus]UTI63235.1 hypothetical protein NBH00_17950 [Paraconexibacter antarcticus]